LGNTAGEYREGRELNAVQEELTCRVPYLFFNSFKDNNQGKFLLIVFFSLQGEPEKCLLSASFE